MTNLDDFETYRPTRLGELCGNLMVIGLFVEPAAVPFSIWTVLSIAAALGWRVG